MEVQTMVANSKENNPSNSFLPGAMLAFAVLAFCGASWAEPLAKRGSFSGMFAWHFAGTVAGDETFTVWGGAGTGAFRNDAGKGFLHAALVVCTSAGVARKDGASDDRGDCVVTDKDGDKAFAKWRCTQCPAIGEFHWAGGTGKYTGLAGRNTYENNYAGPAGSPAGWSAWKGGWELP
jgi:hypothetical protein